VFVVGTIGYTQWDYGRTTKRVEIETQQRKHSVREARKAAIWKQLDMEEGVVPRAAST